MPQTAKYGMNFRLWLESELPAVLYHGAPAKRLASIRRHGLRHDLPADLRNFDYDKAKPYGVFLALTADDAKRWVTHKDCCGPVGDPNPVVFAIQTQSLDPALLRPDPFLVYGYVYLGTIPFSALHIVQV